MQDILILKTRRAGSRALAAAALCVPVLLSGCGSLPDVPDMINPMTWFSDDETEKVASAPEKKLDYPKLSSVPDRPPSLDAEQAKISKGLAADRDNARYIDDKIGREVARRIASPPPRAVPPPPQARTALPPRAVPPPPLPRAVPPPPGAVPPPPQLAARTPPVAALRPVPAPPPIVRPSAVPPPPALRPTAPARVANPPAPVVMRPALPPAPSPAPPRVSADPAPSASRPTLYPGESVKIGTIYFADGSTGLRPADVSILEQVAMAQRQTGSVIRIVGHASGRARTFNSARRHMINYRVSLDRANAVAAELLRQGVPVGNLRVEGKGDTAPLYAEETANGEAANRRAELYMIN